MESFKPGYCWVCNTVQIWYVDNGRRILTDQYAEFSFVLSDQMIYRHAVCKKCIVELTDKKVADLVEKIKSQWSDEMVGWATDKQFKDLRSLEVKAYDIEEEKALKKFEQVTKDDFEKHLQEVKKQKDIAKKVGDDLIA